MSRSVRCAVRPTTCDERSSATTRRSSRTSAPQGCAEGSRSSPARRNSQRPYAPLSIPAGPEAETKHGHRNAPWCENCHAKTPRVSYASITPCAEPGPCQFSTPPCSPSPCSPRARRKTPSMLTAVPPSRSASSARAATTWDAARAPGACSATAGTAARTTTHVRRDPFAWARASPSAARSSPKGPARYPGPALLDFSAA